MNIKAYKKQSNYNVSWECENENPYYGSLNLIVNSF